MVDGFDYMMGAIIATFIVMLFGVVGFAVYQDAHLAKECIAAGKQYDNGNCR